MKKKVKSNLSLYSLHDAEACYEFPGPISASLRLQATKLLSKKCRSDSEQLATLCSILPAWGLYFKPSGSETSALPLDAFRKSKLSRNFSHNTSDAWNCLFCRDGFHCAQERGGFWHNECAKVHPNNVWTPNQTSEMRHVYWHPWKELAPIKETVIKMRCDW